MNSAPAMAALPGTLTLGGASFVILAPTPGDKLRVDERMREMALAKCVSPVDYAMQFARLPEAAFRLLLSEAIKLGAGGGVKPHPDAVWDEYTSLEGVRWRAWYHISRVLPDYPLEAATEAITPDNLFVVAEGLDKALKLASADPNAPAPATGPAS